MYQLIKGSIFDTKCDLIIIPCNNQGGISGSILKTMTINDVPYYYNESMNPGDVCFRTNVGNFANASVIGYAASVDINKSSSSVQIVEAILDQIRTYCNENSLHMVNIPLLGTGAGGLSVLASFEILTHAFDQNSDVRLNIFAYSSEHYQEIRAAKNLISSASLKSPRVFISYTGTNQQNKTWVKMLASRLRSNGVDARIDIYHLKHGSDLPQWMTNELILADKVLLICDKAYAVKAGDRTGGVGWETMIIQGDMLTNQETNKYLAIVREPEIDKSLPIYVRSRYAFDWTNEDKYNEEFDQLLYELFDCDLEPPLGDIPERIKSRLAPAPRRLAGT